MPSPPEAKVVTFETPVAQRATVLKALRAAGPPHSPYKLTVVERADWFVALSDGKFSMVEYIPPETGRRTVNHLSRRYKVPKAWFYEPTFIPG